MRYRTLLATLTALTITACGDSGAGDTPAPPGPPVAGTFQATSITENGQVRPLTPDTRVRLTFDGDSLTAESGCNRLNARARFDVATLAVSDLSTTDIACPPEHAELERWLAAFLEAGPSWRYDQTTYDQTTLVLATRTARIHLTPR
ncbi:META domain-containing protein [Phytohabitans kaempferiae]|uniref:META domain-containing protein n=1 Tax=Phytohabitans kaempferiae TaxID=1620943 RepID=A0ABV6M9C1_9ACTN